MKNSKSFYEKLIAFDQEVEDAFLRDPDSWDSGRAARAFWNFVACCTGESFAITVVADHIGWLGGSRDETARALKEAEEDIERGVRALALLLADPKNHEELSGEFREIGICHPHDSYVGFLVRHNPERNKRLERFVKKQNRRGKSREQVKRDIRMYFKQLNLGD